MTEHPDPSKVPPMDPAWEALAWRDRMALLLGRRDPDGSAMARAALAQAQRLRQRAVLLAAMGGMAATCVWAALSLLLGSSNGAGRLVTAAVFGGVFFVSYLTLARAQARRLERRSRHVFDKAEDANQDA